MNLSIATFNVLSNKQSIDKPCKIFLKESIIFILSTDFLESTLVIVITNEIMNILNVIVDVAILKDFKVKNVEKKNMYTVMDFYDVGGKGWIVAS